MTDGQNAGQEDYQHHQSVTGHELDEGEHVHCLVAPVARLVQQRVEVRLPDRQDPVVAENEPDEQEDAEKRLGELRRFRQNDVTVVLVRVVDLVQPLVSPRSHLFPQHGHEFEQTETAAD